MRTLLETPYMVIFAAIAFSLLIVLARRPVSLPRLVAEAAAILLAGAAVVWLGWLALTWLVWRR